MQRVFLIGTKGGTGTSSVTANLARCLADAAEPTLVVELNAQNQLARHFAIPWLAKTGWQNANDLHTLQNCFYQTQSGIQVLPYGKSNQSKVLTAKEVVDGLNQFELTPNTWVLFDITSTDFSTLSLNSTDIVLEVANCDAINHSLLYQKFTVDKFECSAQYYVLVNKFNSHSDVESDIFTLWQHQLTHLSPVFIHADEAIKVAVTHANQAVALYPANSCRADFERLCGWLSSLQTQMNKSEG
ncbi:cellulose biosynthesis protein BcsQ [Catenovulum sp. 2E275]|uniref:cellulose biosynthesis protein BcsQ n=1 Tax=Catenovulum sp. 2E275 TaxID=2980497 RepID=UPI0021CF02BB|nr:cellulose biosynthesis protein BcsQ [Catenovulum sp. 2E275]MCU4677042.1 cellulose biosynthesis protein BcsQ [Catenovulum sp. 2E275]